MSFVFEDIPSCINWIKVEEINKGWSKDKKYFIITKNDEKLLLRLSDIETYDKKLIEFETMKEIYKLGVNMSKPLEFGICGDGRKVYSLLSWIQGCAADDIIEEFPKEEQYELGIKAGEILKKFHSIKAPLDQPEWEERMTLKINRHLEAYKACGIKVSNDHYALHYIEHNLHLLKNRHQAYQHGDFHIGNLIITPDKKIGVIDFNRWDYGDPYEEFYKVVQFSKEFSIPFAVGQIDGYFQNNIPGNFFDLVALYIADVLLYSVAWAIPFGDEDIKGMLKRADMILKDYDNFNTTIPKWYSEFKK